MRTLALIIIALILCLTLVPVVFAHEWYDAIRCNNKDCEELPEGSVAMTPEGYHVKYIAKLGLHVDQVVPFDKARPSHDGHFHGCANSYAFLCLYVPLNT